MRRGRILILFAMIVLFGVAAIYLVMRPRTPPPTGDAEAPLRDQGHVIISMLMVDLDPEFQTILPNQALSLASPDFGLITALICTEFKITQQGTGGIKPAPPPVGLQRSIG